MSESQCFGGVQRTLEQSTIVQQDQAYGKRHAIQWRVDTTPVQTFHSLPQGWRLVSCFVSQSPHLSASGRNQRGPSTAGSTLYYLAGTATEEIRNGVSDLMEPNFAVKMMHRNIHAMSNTGCIQH